jgi:4-hydroxy-tetrahydrodipicolinate synthase
MLKGSLVAIITPFKNGEVDFDGLGRLIESHIQNGTSGIVPCGTTGESATLSYEEHKQVIDFTIKKVAKRVPVIAGTGSNSTVEAIELAQHAKEAGADYHLSITPYYNKPTQEGLYRHFKAIAEAVDLPMILYNVPGRTGVNMSPETVGRLSNIRNVAGIKEATGSLNQAVEVMENVGKDFMLISGDDFINLPMLAVGSTACISVTANIVPRRLSDLYAAWFAGDREKAKEIHQGLMPLHRTMFIETSPIPVKTASYLMGLIDTGELRLPLCPLTDASMEKLKNTLKAQGLI